MGLRAPGVRIFDQVYRWTQAMEGAGVPKDRWECRLTKKQALRLCWELGFSGYPSGPRQSYAKWAWICEMPWAFLKDTPLYGARLVPLLRNYQVAG